MKNTIKSIILILLFVQFSSAAYSQSDKVSNKKSNITSNDEKIQWHTFAEATKLNKKHPKKIFMDVYTDWCGWCKRYDMNTFSNPVIAKYINENFYAVKFNAERKDTVLYKDKKYFNRNPNVNRSVNDLAAYFLKGQMSYPTVVFLNEKMDLLSAVPGYRDPKDFESVINFFGSNAYLKQDFEDYRSSFRGKIED